MARPLYFDLTHLAFRAGVAALTGIDRVDLTYARALASSGELAGGVHHGLVRPQVLPARRVAALVAAHDRRWKAEVDPERDGRYRAVRAWLVGEGAGRAAPIRPVAGVVPELAHKAVGHLRKATAALRGGGALPEGAIYLNVSQHAAERRGYYRWLESRRDVRAVFFLHDLLPLDHPEFWWPGHEALFEARIATILGRADALIVASEAVRERALRELDSRGLKRVPIHAAALPSPLGGGRRAQDIDPALAEIPYCLMIGTIEPRKNHRLILEVWRRLAESGRTPPKLVLVGGRGWGDPSAVDLALRSPAVRGTVLEASGLGDGALRRLIVNARAVLAPSFAEGFGLPIVEALTLGTPIIASDIPVFREVARGRALLIDLADQRAWGEAVMRLGPPDLSGFPINGPPEGNDGHAGYFGEMFAFLRSL